VPESFTANMQDTRSFGTQQQRLIDDLNRPDLQNIAAQYLQDAMRFFQRKPFFFNETDNSLVPGWSANTFWPFGSTIQVNVGGTIYAFVQTVIGTVLGGATAPSWPSTIFTVPNSQPPVLPPPTLPVAGAVQDNNAIWVNSGNYQQFNTTQLSTVYNWNQYQPPIDYVSPHMVECTWSGNLRQQLRKISYGKLRSYDVIRPSPPYSYPTMWAYFQSTIYLWPYPNGFYPLTLSYRTAPQVITDANAFNFWTTIAERLIRKYAQASIEREVLKDVQAAQITSTAVLEELNALRSQGVMQNNADSAGIPSSDW
jgi:hypothetical protein